MSSGAIIIRYAHSVLAPDAKNYNGGGAASTSSSPSVIASQLPLIARRLVAELSAPRDTSSSSQDCAPVSLADPPCPILSYRGIDIKNKYFRANVFCVIADDNLIDSSEAEQQQQQKNNGGEASTAPQHHHFSTSQLLATLRSARIPFGLVQLADLGVGANSAISSAAGLDIMSDQDCAATAAVAGSLHPHLHPPSQQYSSAPLFNICLAVSSAEQQLTQDVQDEKAVSSPASSPADSKKTRPPPPQAPSKKARSLQLLQSLRERCVAVGVECVSYVFRGPAHVPLPPPPGVEKRGLLTSQEDLTGSVRVLQVAFQSLWCGDPMTTTGNNNNNYNDDGDDYDGMPRNIFAVFSSSRFTCEFTHRLLCRTKNVDCRLVTAEEAEHDKEEGEEEAAKHDDQKTKKRKASKGRPPFFGSPDGQRFSFRVRSKYVPLSEEIHCFYSPLDMLTCPRTAALGAAELRRLLATMPQCHVLCFHILVGGDGIAGFLAANNNSNRGDSKHDDDDGKAENRWWVRPTTVSDVGRVLQCIADALATVPSPPLQQRDGVSCVVVVENRGGGGGSADDNDQAMVKESDFGGSGLLAKLMHVGCEVVFVAEQQHQQQQNDDDDTVKSENEKPDKMKQKGKKKRRAAERDEAEGLERLEEILQCAAWAGPRAPRKPLVGANSLVVLNIHDSAAAAAASSSAIALLARGFSNDADDTAAAHDRKTEWLRAELNKRQQQLPAAAAAFSSSSSLASIYEFDLDTKYFRSTVDVAIVNISAASSASYASAQKNCNSLIHLLQPMGLVILLSTSAPSQSATSIVGAIVESCCEVAPDEENENFHHRPDPESNEQSGAAAAPCSGVMLLGPNSARVAILANSNRHQHIAEPIKKLCSERFVNILPQDDNDAEDCDESGDDAGRKKTTARLTVSAELFDSLSCIEWPKRTEKDISSGKNGDKQSGISSASNDATATMKPTQVRTNDALVEKALFGKAQVSSLIDSVSNSTSNKRVDEETKSSAEDANALCYFTCALPPHFYFDPVAKKSFPRTTSSADQQKAKNEDDDDDNDFSGLLAQMREVRDSKRLSWEEREQRAAALSTEFAKKLKNDDLADDIIKNMM